jgi:hypothetical protein
MNKRNSINLLRQTGIILIALPEPFTTPLGVACVAAAQYMSKSLEKARLKLLRRERPEKLPGDFIYNAEINKNCCNINKLNYYSYDRGRRHKIAARFQYNRTAMESQGAFYTKPEMGQPVQNNDIKPDSERIARIKAQTATTLKNRLNNRIEPEAIPHKVNIEALSRRYQHLNTISSEDNTKIIKCNANMQLLQQHRDCENRQNENAKIKAPILELRFHDIDAETLVKRYRKEPFGGASPA